jgi:serpin B
MRSFLSFLLLLSIYHGVLFSQEDSSNIAERLPAQMIVEGGNQLGFTVYQKIKKKNGNFCFSPYSLSYGTAMVAAGSRGASANELQQVLGYSLSFLTVIGDLNTALNSSKSSLIANAWWIDKNIELLPTFEKKFDRNFKQQIERVNYFTEPVQASRQINEWNLKKTSGKIAKIVSPQNIPAQTKSLLTLAFTMKGQWLQPFEMGKTKLTTFTTSSNQTVSVEMMHQSGDFLFNDDKWDVALIPYFSESKDPQFGLIIALPKEGIDFNQAESDLSIDRWNGWISQFKMTPLVLQLPKFRLNSHYDLKEDFKDSDLALIFSLKRDFSEMTEAENFSVSNGFHSAFLRINENGSDAGGKGFIPKNITQETKEIQVFNVNRSFVFFVWDKGTGAIVLMGRVSRP